MKKLRQHAAFKSIAGIVLLLLVFFGIVSLIGFHGFTDALLTQYADGAFLMAETAAHFVNPDRMEEYENSGGTSEDYLKALDRMDQLCNSTGATFVYVIEPDRTDYAHITFLFSTINAEVNYTKYDFGYVRETTNDDYRAKYRAICEEGAKRELVIRDKGYIETDPHITAMIPLTGTDGQVKAILCVQRQMEVLANARQNYLKKVTVTLIALTALVIAVQSVFLNQTLLRPLKQISEEAIRFSSENVTTGKKLTETIRNTDEIGQLAASIDRMEEQIQRYVGDLTKITAERERIRTELSLAKAIQASMLPSVFPPFPNREEFDLYASMTPAKEVGGDFYDFFLIDEDHLGLVIADVSGKGVPAALFMMIAKVILQSCAMLGRSAAEILTKTNEALCSNNQVEMFVTVWLGILEISTGKLTAANAGHEYPAIKTPDGRFELLKGRHGFVIGGMEGVQYKEYELQLQPGSTLFVYTDGIPEAIDRGENMFGTERMLDALNEQPDGTPEEIIRNVGRAVADFVEDAPCFDDMTMLCLSYRRREAERPAEDTAHAEPCTNEAAK